MDCFPVSSFGLNFPFTQTSSPLLGGDAKVAFSLWWGCGRGLPLQPSLIHLGDSSAGGPLGWD